MQADRRATRYADPQRLEAELSLDQILTLRELEHFGWELKIVRRPMFEAPIAIVFDGTRTCYGVIAPDGTLDERPSLAVRH
jgi:hypothetical protein